MIHSSEFELPQRQMKLRQKATRLQWYTIVYVVSAAVAIFLVSGGSQAMKASLIQVSMSVVPPVAFLLSSQFDKLQANAHFPYGYHRFISAGYLVGSFALVVAAVYIIGDSTWKLSLGQRTTIGSMHLFDSLVWQGWIMIAVLSCYGGAALVFGQIKLPLAGDIHDKQLYSDAKMLKATWMSAAAAIVGITAIGWGVWWADMLAAAVIGFDAFKDGIVNTRRGFADLLDGAPRTIDNSEVHPVVDEILDRLKGYQWLEDADVRLREEGRLIYGEAFVVPKEIDSELLEHLSDIADDLEELSWNIHDIVVVPVAEIPDHLRSDIFQ